MKLSEHTEKIRQLIDNAFRNRMGRMGITATSLLPVENIPPQYIEDRKRIETIREVFITETGTPQGAYEKLVEECTFTLFNRIAALKVMEAHTLHAEIITRRTQHGDRSFAHFLWLEQNPQGRSLEMEGFVEFIESQLDTLSGDIPLFGPQYLFHLLPTAIELNGIINAFNQIETDPQVEPEIWKSDDVLGWLYESYNNYKKAAHKESGDKTEYNKVSIQSQVYTPRWVVKFLVDNSLGKLYLEMFPDSEIKSKYKIANAPQTQTRERKPLTEISMIDLANGSGNFLLYGFDLFYDLYIDQIDNYGADYDPQEIPALIIRHNLHGIDIDDRAVQLAQLGLYIKAKRKNRNAKIDHFNVVSSDFFLPEYDKVKHLFENGEKLKPELEKIVTELWGDLQQAYKFGSLLRLEEKFSVKLHGIAQKHNGLQVTLFGPEELANLESFRATFFDNLQKAVAHNAEKQGKSFLNVKTGDAITFLKIMTQKYDVAVANPPYTDSGDFGAELKRFVEENYKKPYKFNANLYAAFIKKCCELTDVDGFVALIHPHTFMFIKSFEDVRKYIIDNTHIELLVDYGLDRVNLFGPGILLDATWYVLNKKMSDAPGTYFSITANQQEKFKQGSLEQAYNDLIDNRQNERIYTLDQAKLKIIEGWPFIYWISDGFREKFREKALDAICAIRAGIQTSYNERFLRFWWEINKRDIADNYQIDKKRWIKYAKGGPFLKWQGNIWLVIDWEWGGQKIQKYLDTRKLDLHAQPYYFLEGITYSASGSKGISFRHLPLNHLFDIGGASIFLIYEFKDLLYLIGFLNSKLSAYIVNCLNPTVNVQPVDLKRIPFVQPSKIKNDRISYLASENIEIRKALCSFRIIEVNFVKAPVYCYVEATLGGRLIASLNHENAQLAKVLLNEAIINQIVFAVYDLSSEDCLQVETKMGEPVGELPVLPIAREAYLDSTTIENDDIRSFINNLPTAAFIPEQIQEITSEFPSLYQSNNDLESFCIRHQINPINVWYWFRESKVLPPARAAEIAMEFIADACRTILMEDEDGIIPLTGLPGEPRLLDRLEQHCLAQGFSSAQFMQLDGLLGKPLNEYIEHHFFRNFSDHLNLFMYLPKTPFIWHLSSGEHQGFEAYIIIYKWNRDSLFKLKSQYLNKRTEKLEFRQVELGSSSTAQAQTEKETIRMQLQEIAEFSKKIDELIAEGYDPKLDDGVGKNIAPLQKKGMLRCEVLNKKQLEKYLKADW